MCTEGELTLRHEGGKETREEDTAAGGRMSSESE